MDRESSPDYKQLFLKLQEEKRQSTQNTTFIEFIRSCHELLSQPLQVRTPSCSTQGTLPLSRGKYCPTRLDQWEDCHVVQQKIYNSVCDHLQADGEHPYRLFWPVTELQGVAKSLGILHFEDELTTYEKLGVENHVRNIISELCNRSEAQQHFRLGKGVSFESHTNSFEAGARYDPSQRPRPDRFCIHHKLDGSSDVLMTVEYKPPHKLTVENLRAGLRPMNFRDEVAQRESIPIDKTSKLQYNAEQMVGAVLVQEYHVMICEGLEYSYVTIGLALVLLRVPLEAPDTLLYFLCEPNMEPQDDLNYRQPTTAITRILCLALMSCQSHVRDDAWRKQAKSKLHTWATSFALIRSQIPEMELQETPSGSEYTGSAYEPSSSPLQSPTPQARTQVESGCAPSRNINHPPDSGSDSDSSQGAPEPRRKRNLSQVTSSPPQQLSS